MVKIDDISLIQLTDFFFFFEMFIYFRKNTNTNQGRGRGRRGQRLQSRLCAESREPNEGLELPNCKIMT